MRRFKIKSIVFASTIIIIGGIDSLPLGCPISITIALVITGTADNLWCLFNSEKTTKSLQSLIEIQSGILTANKLGNTYLEKLKNDIKIKGRTINFHELINKALQIDPDNPDVIHFYSHWSACGFLIAKGLNMFRNPI